MGTWRHHNVTTDAAFEVEADSLTITNSQPCQVATLNATLRSGTVADGHEIASFFDDDGGEVVQFAGIVSVATKAHYQRTARHDIQARDFTTLLDDTVITVGNRLVVESATARVAWIMAQTPTFSITTTGVATISTTIEAHDYTGMSRREALQHVAGIVGAVFYVDFDRDLHFYLHDTVIAAAFALSDSPSAPDSYKFADFELDRDRTDFAEDVYVQGDGISVWRPDGGPSGGPQRTVVNSQIKTLSAAQGVGDVELERIGTVQQSGRLTQWQPGLAPGETVTIINGVHSLNAGFVISRIVTRPLANADISGGWQAEYEVEFADRLLCRPTLGDQLADGNRIEDPDDTCEKKLVWLGSSESRLTVSWGRRGKVFTFDGDFLQRWRPSLERIWRVEVPEAVQAIFDHTPEGSEEIARPVLLGALGIGGAVGYHSITGQLRWDVSAETELLVGIAAQDRPRFWLVGLFASGDPQRLQLRRGDTGAVLSQIALPDEPSRIRGTPNGQHVAVASLDTGPPRVWTIRFYDRELTLVETVTIEELASSADGAFRFDDIDWAPDDDFNLYVQNYGAPYQFVTKWNRDGEELWSTDLHAANGYSYSHLSTSRAQNVLLVDDAVLRIAGHIGRTTPASTGPGWGAGVPNPSDAVMLTLSRAAGSILRVSRFGGTTIDDDVQACSVIRATRDGCLFLGGAVNGQSNVGSVEGDEAPGTAIQQWLMRLPTAGSA